MATFSKGYTFKTTEQLSPAKMNSLINDGSLGDITEDDIGGDFGFYSHGDTAPSVSMAPSVWYDTTPGAEGLKYNYWSPSNASISAWLYATPRREAYYYCSSPVSMGTPLFVFKVGEAGWSDYDGLSLPTVWLAGDRSEITPACVVAMESVAAAGPVKCAWSGIIPADTFGSQVSLGDLLYVDPDAPTKFKTGSFNPWARGLVSHWTLDGASGATRADLYGTAHLIDPVGIPSVGGKIDTAAEFDDTPGDEQLYCNPPADHDWSGDAFMLNTWIYMDDKSGSYHWFFCGQWDSPNDKSWMLWYDRVGDRLNFSCSNDGGVASVGVTANNFGSPPTAEWIHVVAWYSKGGGSANIAVNNTTPDTASCASSGLYVSASPLRFGLGADVGASWRLDGRVDHTTIWKGRTPSRWEIDALYNMENGLTDILGGETSNPQSMIVGSALRKIDDNSGLNEDFLLWGSGPAMQDIT